MKIRFAASPLIVILAAGASWSAGARGRAAVHASFGRISAPRSFAAAPLRATAFRSYAGFGASGRGFSRGFKATPVVPSQTPATGSGAQTTGGYSATSAPFYGTANNTLIENRGDARVLTTNAGGQIAFNPPRIQYITSAPGVFVGPADKAQTPNPGWSASGGASGLNAIIPNAQN